MATGHRNQYKMEEEFDSHLEEEDPFITDEMNLEDDEGASEHVVDGPERGENEDEANHEEGQEEDGADGQEDDGPEEANSEGELQEEQLSDANVKNEEGGDQSEAPAPDNESHEDDDQEFEIDPKKMMMLEPEVDIIEDPDDGDVPPAATRPPVTQPRYHQPSILRKRPANTSNTGYPVQSRGRFESNGYQCRRDERRMEPDEEEEEEMSGDDRVGCRSLVCDSNGIIIAEMVYRCMICAFVSDSISVAQKHYQSTHMSKSEKMSSRGPKDHQPQHSTPVARSPEDDIFDVDDEDPVGGMEEEDDDNDFERDQSFDEPMPEQSFQRSVPLTYNLPSGLKQLQQKVGSSSGNHNGSPSSILKRGGNFVQSPSPLSYVPGRNAKNGVSPSHAAASSSSAATRGGYVTCAVCNITKYYASVQRRYGQFTCMGCAKFFGRFLIKPRRYYCPNLGSCPLDISPRCKACLLQACITTYNIDEKRMRIVNANRPLKKSGGVLSQSRQTNSIQPQNPQFPYQSSSGNMQQQQQQGSMTFAPPPLVKAPSTFGARGIQRPNPMAGVQHRQEASPHLNSSLGMKTIQRPAVRPVVRSPVSSVLASSRAANGHSVGGRKGAGCRQCVNCMADDCGKCNYCLDKPKFGGPNTLKKKCVQKKCLLMQTSVSPIRIRYPQKK